MQRPENPYQGKQPVLGLSKRDVECIRIAFEEGVTAGKKALWEELEKHSDVVQDPFFPLHRHIDEGIWQALRAQVMGEVNDDKTT